MIIHRLIKDYPIPYSLYVKLYLKRIKKLDNIPYFESGTQLYFGAVPRSGNTYLNHLIRDVLPELKSVHHLHSLAVVKISLSRRLPTFILIRNPEECISSAYLKRSVLDNKGEPLEEKNKKLIKRFLNDYLVYYKYVEKKRNQIHIIPFQRLIKSPEAVISEIANVMEYQIKVDDLHHLVQESSLTYRSNTSKYGSSRPNEAKEIEKQKIKEELYRIEKYEEAFNLYNRIMKTIKN